MALPVQAESDEVLARRWRAAIQKQWNSNTIIETGDRPGLHRENVFDTEDGVRCIVNRELAGDYDTLHFSLSFWDYPAWKGKVKSIEYLNVYALSFLKRISASKERNVGAAASHITPTGILHLIFDWDDEMLTWGID